MAQVNAGRVRFVGRGEYDNSTQYYTFDLVNYNGNSYFAKSNTIGNLPTNSTYWQLVAEKGNTGSVGPTGETGNGISSITKTSTSGLVDTYTITFTNGQTTTYEITNGANGDVVDVQVDGTSVVDNGIANIVGINEIKQELEDMYNLLPKVQGTGETITLDGTVAGKMLVDLKGNTSQETTTGVQLFDKNNINGLNVYLDTANNKLVSNDNNKSIYISCKPNTTYTISKTPSKRFGVAYTYTTPANNTAIYGTTTNYDGASITITTDTDAQYLVVWVINSNISGEISYQTAIDTLQIEYGFTATSYEKYTGGIPVPNPDYPQDIHVVSGNNSINVCGKNLYNGLYTAKKYINYNTGEMRNSDDWSATDYIEIEPNTNYTLSGITNSGWVAGTSFYDSSKTFISSVYSTEYSFTTPANTKYLRFSMNSETPTNVMLEKGSTPTTYEAYKSASYPINLGDIELCKIRDYQDYIYKYNDKWYLHKEILKGVLDGTETWNSVNSGSLASWYTNKFFNNIKGISVEDVGLYCTIFGYGGYGSNAGGKPPESLFFNVSTGTTVINGNISIPKTNYSSKSTLTTLLREKTPTIYLQLATPTTTEITDSTLISQLEAVKRSYNEQTNITQTNDDKPFILDVTALKQLTE